MERKGREMGVVESKGGRVGGKGRWEGNEVGARDELVTGWRENEREERTGSGGGGGRIPG